MSEAPLTRLASVCTVLLVAVNCLLVPRAATSAGPLPNDGDETTLRKAGVRARRYSQSATRLGWK